MVKCYIVKLCKYLQKSFENLASSIFSNDEVQNGTILRPWIICKEEKSFKLFLISLATWFLDSGLTGANQILSNVATKMEYFSNIFRCKLGSKALKK